MPIADWIHKYPGVAALFQQDEDELQGVSCEEPPTETTPMVSRHAAVCACQSTECVAPCQHFCTIGQFLGEVCRVSSAYVHTYGPSMGYYIYAAPDVHTCLLRVAHPYSGSIMLDHAPYINQLRVFGLLCLPWRIPIGQWFLHWTPAPNTPRFVRTDRPDFWQHLIAQPIPLGVDCEAQMSEDVTAEVCMARRPAPVCSCGGYVMEWR